jgi:ADP-heptose:LPS heptosyltransferase
MHNEFVSAGGSHVIEHYLTMLRPLGIDAPAVRFDLLERPAEARMADDVLRSTGLSRGLFAILNPGAGWPSKVWPAERYGELARVLAARRGMQSLVVWCGDSELRLAETIVGTSGGKALLAPATSMTELAALCRRAGLFVGSDTGPMHLSAAVGTPTVSLHGPSRAEWCGAYGAHGASVQVRYEAGSSLQRRKADDSAMRAITIDMVADACDRVLMLTASRKFG